MPTNTTIGDNVRLGRHVRLEATPPGTIDLGDGCTLEDGVRIQAVGGAVSVGAGAVLGENSVVVAHERIRIGAHARLGQRVALLDAEPRFDDPELPTRKQGLRSAPIEIGERAVVGHQAALRPGARVPAGGVVQPGAVLPAGQPARGPRA